MTPAARLSAVIGTLAELERTNQPADQFLREWGRRNRYAGSKDRAAVAERVFSIFRYRASFAWRMGSDSARSLVIASLLAEDMRADDIAALFSGEGYGPAALSEAERAALEHPPAGEPPLHVQGEFPAFLEAELAERFGDGLLAEMRAMTERAPVDLRVNTLKATREEVLGRLRADSYAAEPTPFAPHGIRIPSGEGAAQLARHALHECGAFEFQDEAAQIACDLCDVAPGMRVLDLAAGAGGKALALAAALNNQGSIIASDIAAGRLKQIGPRARRAGVTCIHTHESPRGEFDRVLVDAPCSGSGVWRRQPEQKWRLTPERLAELRATQDGLLVRAAGFVAPGGRLIYATCSLLPGENDARIAAFLDLVPGFAAMSAAGLWRGAAVPPGLGAVFRASPYATGTDGFFAVVLERVRGG